MRLTNPKSTDSGSSLLLIEIDPKSVVTTAPLGCREAATARLGQSAAARRRSVPPGSAAATSLTPPTGHPRPPSRVGAGSTNPCYPDLSLGSSCGGGISRRARHPRRRGDRHDPPLRQRRRRRDLVRNVLRGIPPRRRGGSVQRTGRHARR